MATLKQALVSTVGAALGAAVSGVFEDEAPEGQAFPYVVFSLVAAPDDYTFTRRAMTDYVYQVKVVDQGNDKTAADAADAAIDAALTDQPLAGVAGHQRTRREESFSYSERDEGVRYLHVGANYRIVVVP